jgi:acyl-CoA thioesterase
MDTESDLSTEFDRDTAVRREADGRYSAGIVPGWRAGRGPHGGYLAAIILRALIDTVGDPERTPRSLTIHYAAAPEPGRPVEIQTTIERRGRSLSTLSARMTQDGKLTSLALAAFSVPWRSPSADELPMPPDLAGPDAERRSTPGLFKGAPEFTRHLVLQPRVGAIPFAGSGAPMRVGGWTGLPDESRAVDAPALALFADAWFPPSFIALDEPAISPTVDLTVHFRKSISACECDPAALCMAIFETRLLHDGLFEEDGVIWAPDGSVLAQSRQLAIIMPTRQPVLQPANLAATNASSESDESRTN